MAGFISPFAYAKSRRAKRKDELRQLLMHLGRRDFEARHPSEVFAPVLVVMPSYQEADNIEHVLKAIPPEVDNISISTLVVIDGGDDETLEIVARVGAMCAVLPVNMGQGFALRLGYELAAAHGARYVVTIDADGQNDPSEVSNLLIPLLSGQADVVIASRRIGFDEATDSARRIGVSLFSWVISHLIRQRVTDTTNGFRAFRIEVLADMFLEQDQFQTAEVIVSAGFRGWRIADAPATWHARTSGESKKVVGASAGVGQLGLFLGANVYFGIQYARVIVRTWRRERSKRQVDTPQVDLRSLWTVGPK
jgi:glycosyltransferase involved in cell wall biosynthesis